MTRTTLTKARLFEAARRTCPDNWRNRNESLCLDNERSPSLSLNRAPRQQRNAGTEVRLESPSRLHIPGTRHGLGLMLSAVDDHSRRTSTDTGKQSPLPKSQDCHKVWLCDGTAWKVQSSFGNRQMGELLPELLSRLERRIGCNHRPANRNASDAGVHQR